MECSLKLSSETQQMSFQSLAILSLSLAALVQMEGFLCLSKCIYLTQLEKLK